MTHLDPETSSSDYKDETSHYDPELDDPGDDATGYENDADAPAEDQT